MNWTSFEQVAGRGRVDQRREVSPAGVGRDVDVAVGAVGPHVGRCRCRPTGSPAVPAVPPISLPRGWSRSSGPVSHTAVLEAAAARPEKRSMSTIVKRRL